MYYKNYHLFTVIFFVLATMISKSQVVAEGDSTLVDDPKVGLVLSGGGAKGLAHIGALKVIEEAGVRIDYIGGTSMGAIIGSLYASGYSAKELDSIFKTVDFRTLIQDDLPRNAKTFYEREDAEKYALTLPFDTFKLGLPQGLSKGQNFFNEFSKYTTHVSNINDFSQLPIPFFCIATNISNGKEVLLDSGYLPQAVAASSALPSIFSPVEVDGVLLTDGGVTNNFPVDEVRKKGADMVIGIDVQDSLMSKKDLNSLTNIMLQIGNFRTINAMKGKIGKTDVYIHPDIRDFSLLSFNEISRIIENGEKAASLQLEKLKSIQQRQKPGIDSVISKKASDTIRINNISIEGNQRYTRAYIKGKLKLRKPGKITYKKLYEGINNLSATGNFERINHRITKRNWGNELMVNVEESENTTLLRFAIHYDDLFKTAGLFNFTKKRLLFSNDVLSADLILGDNFRYEFAYYIDKGYYWSVGIKNLLNRYDKAIEYDQLRRNFSLPDVEVNTINLDFFDVQSQFYIETILDQKFSFGLGVEHRRFNLKTNTIGMDEGGNSRIVLDNNDYGSFFSYLKFDSLNKRYFPTSGVFFDGNLHYYLLHSNEINNQEAFALFNADFSYAVQPFRNAAFQIDLNAGGRFGGETIQSFNFFVGGFGAKNMINTVPFYGYDFLAINGDSFARAALTFDYEIFRKNHVNISANYANIGTQLYRSGRWFEAPEYSGYSLGYGIDTFIGPLQFKYSISPEINQDEWFISLGFWF